MNDDFREGEKKRMKMKKAKHVTGGNDKRGRGNEMKSVSDCF